MAADKNETVTATATSSPWGGKEKADWLTKQSIKRSYLEQVVSKIDSLKDDFEVIQYGSLSYDPERYPLFIIKTKKWNKNHKTVLVTGGVHGYETSGVHGAIRFAKDKAQNYATHFNLIVAPCISPWGYETINRWNPNAIDPNRSFYIGTPAEESAAIMKKITELGCEIFAHIDLHETTDTDNTEFMPALAKRDATKLTLWQIPDGFYLVGDSENPVAEFQRAMIESVQKVTHIALADDEGKIIGEDLSQHGVINYPGKKLGLCSGFTNSQFVTTTEVYPDSAKVTEEDCVNAQVAAVEGGLDYLIAHL